MILAYIDAALGSMLLQALAGMILAGIVMGRRIIAAPLAWLHSGDSVQNTNGELEELAEATTD
jgi:hypothetical protein